MRALIAIAISLLTVQAFASAELRVRPYSRVSETTSLRLLDVVDGSGMDAATRDELQKIVLGDAPRLGEQRIFTNKAIAMAMRSGAKNREWTVQIPRRVVVENRGYELNDMLVKQELVSHWRSLCNECQFRIKSLSVPAIPAELTGRPYEIELGVDLPRGQFSRKLTIRRTDGQPLYFWITGQTEIRKSVPVLSRSVPMGYRIASEDIRFELRDVTFSTDGIPTRDEIVGQQARMGMKAEDIIWRNSLQREKAVRRGEMVRVVAGSPGWEVNVQAQTEQDGYVGDVVNLRNIQSNKKITGRVKAPGEVVVE